MKIFRLFTIAAAALMMAACSEDVTQIINGGKKEFTATIAAPNKGGTRTAYNESGGVINVAWTVGDKIALVHNGVKDVVTVTAVDNTTGKATISGYITNATNGSAVTLVYPAALVQTATGSNNYDPDLTNLRSQDGTLGYIQENIDFREDNTLTLSVDGIGVTLSSDANLSSKIAILKLTLKDNGVSPATLNATQVKINKGTDILASTTSIDATSEVYLAVPSVTTSSTLTIEATVGGFPYTYTKENITVVPQKYYQSTVNLSKTIVLSIVTAATTIQNGYTVTGTLAANVQISIANDATVTLDGVTINGVNDSDYSWAGITCLGDATIILKDGTTNTVKGFYATYPGIHAAHNTSGTEYTLTITGNGTLNASSRGTGAGIGGGDGIACGNIEIQGGNITATGGDGAAGIGSGNGASCGTITITSDVTSVTATKGTGATNSIGEGYRGTCGTVTIGCTLDTDGNPVGGTTGAISTSPYTYDPSVPAYTMAANAAAGDVGKLICTDGHIHAYNADAACTKARVAKIIYIGTTGHATYSHGLALALTDEASTMAWQAAIDACSAKNTSTPVTDATWLLASKDQWNYMLGTNGAGSYTALRDGFGDITGASNLQSDGYWSRSEYETNPAEFAWMFYFNSGSWGEYPKAFYNVRVRACLAF